jgi:hypothetical protein
MFYCDVLVKYKLIQIFCYGRRGCNHSVSWKYAKKHCSIRKLKGARTPNCSAILREWVQETNDPSLNLGSTTYYFCEFGKIS